METEITKILWGAVGGAVSAAITYFVTLKSRAAQMEQDKRQEQRYKYFLPFKHQCMELRHRLEHILNRLDNEGVKKEKLLKHFRQDYTGKSKGWYFTDYYSRKEGHEIPGGYFITSTLYMHCQLYLEMYQLQREYPFVDVKLKTRYNTLINTNGKLKEALAKLETAEQRKKEPNSLKNKLDEISKHQKTLSVSLLLEAIRVSTNFSGGVHYALQNSLGMFITDGDKIIDYEKFVSILNSDTERIKFLPLIKFWTTLGKESKNIEDKQEREELEELKSNVIYGLRTLHFTLLLAEEADLK